MAALRLFVAVWPSADVVAALQEVPRPAVAGVRWTAGDQWHVTLAFLGEVPEDDLGELVARLGSAVGSMEAARAAAGPRTACFGRSVLVVPVSGLEALAAATLRATAGIGAVGRNRRPFVGHLTLARSRRQGADLRSFSGRDFAASWTAIAIDLVRSRSDGTGARYEVLSRFELPPSAVR